MAWHTACQAGAAVLLVMYAQALANACKARTAKMACLAKTSLQRACNHLTQRLLAVCLQAGDRVSSLDVSDNSLAADAANVTRHLPQLSNLKALAMNNCSLTSWPLAGLSPGCLGALQALELCSNSFGVCLPADGLAACPGLKSLDLSGEMRRRCGPAAACYVRVLSLVLFSSSCV